MSELASISTPNLASIVFFPRQPTWHSSFQTFGQTLLANPTFTEKKQKGPFRAFEPFSHINVVKRIFQLTAWASLHLFKPFFNLSAFRLPTSRFCPKKQFSADPVISDTDLYQQQRTFFSFKSLSSPQSFLPTLPTHIQLKRII